MVVRPFDVPDVLGVMLRLVERVIIFIFHEEQKVIVRSCEALSCEYAELILSYAVV